MRRQRSRSAAFTLVELLIVIAIIGILVAILLPAVQFAREASRRVTCVNNMRQWSLAVNIYENTHRKLPPSGDAGFTDGEYDGRRGRMISWMVLVLPYIEEQNLADQFDMRRTIVTQPNEPQATAIGVMLCPSDDSRDEYYSHSIVRGKRFAKGNYAAYVSPFHVEMQHFFPGALTAGKDWKIKNIVDGPSHTLLISEIRVRRHVEDQRGAWALPWNGSSLLAFDMHPDLEVFETGTYKIDPLSLGSTQVPNMSGPNVDMLYDCPDIARAQIEGMYCGVFNPSLFDDAHYLSSAPRSQHPGGVNVAFMEGRIGFLVNEVDEVAMAYMVSANDRRPAQTGEHVR